MHLRHVTGVGATQLSPGPESGSYSEIACSIQSGAIITSGGGWSKQFEMPNYQLQAAQAASLPTGARGVPDVAVMGHNFMVVMDDANNLVDGTSCSAPSFAGMVTLWNDVRLRTNGSSLGFLNPRLYVASLDLFTPCCATGTVVAHPVVGSLLIVCVCVCVCVLQVQRLGSVRGELQRHHPRQQLLPGVWRVLRPRL